MNSQTLFRPEAMSAQLQDIGGNILLRPGISLIALTLMLSVWLTGVVCWLFMGSYSHTETVTGWLEPTAGITHVYSTDPGAIVQDVLVKENQYVERGTPLLHLKRESVLSDNQSVSALNITEINTQIERLNTQLQLSAVNQKNQQARYEQQLSGMHFELTQLSDMKLIIEQKKDLLQAQKDALLQLIKRGYSSQQQIHNIDSQLLDQRYQGQQIGREWLSTQRAIEELKFQHQESQHNFEVQRLNLQNRISDLRQSRTRLYSVNDIVITAPISGKVTQLAVKNGQASQASLPLLALMPDDSEISARLLIPVSAVGQLSPGQSIQIRYDAFPYTQFGTYIAEIEAVTPHLLLPQEIAQMPIQLNGPAYLASAKLNQYQIEHMEQRIDLRAGMTFAAEITVRERNLIQWLFEPVYGLNGGLL